MMLPGFNPVFNACNHNCTWLDTDVSADAKSDCFVVLVFTVLILNNMFFVPVLVPESRSQIEKVREKNGIHLSDKLANSGWVSCQQSRAFKKTAVCEPIPLRPLEEN